MRIMELKGDVQISWYIKVQVNNEGCKQFWMILALLMAHGCLGLRFALMQLVTDKITCAITNTASMPQTDIIAMWIQVTVLVCDGCVKCMFFIRSLTASSENKRFSLNAPYRSS